MRHYKRSLYLTLVIPDVPGVTDECYLRIIYFLNFGNLSTSVERLKLSIQEIWQQT